ncbi:MAG: peroxiredoxin [Burkholderiales bacterium]|nr:peroxiredoxin [Burkholderiales bacterium]
MLQPGEPAPAFDLPDADMNMVNLDGFRNHCTVVLYFYPRDDTPGCTLEAIDFSDLEQDFRRLNTVVLGVSMDDCLSHGSFRDKHGLSVQLLADVEGEVCRRYAVLQEKEVDGRKKTGIMRSTFIIDRKGVIRHALYGVNPRGHVAEVLTLVRNMSKSKKC